ncbi:MAG: protein-methionine-sulfoxide reductase catalytic subunit MsrP [Gammaproteobacteria bacterium]|nr:protein-methionine-sulfoxide reductase catalytic subunit MsrP [Gammaproteobacteria bacterium]
MLINSKNQIPASEITPESVYLSRRKFIGQSSTAVLVGAAATPAIALPSGWVEEQGYSEGEPIGEKITPEDIATRYNNFYEFGTGKEDPSKKAHVLTTDPWSIEVAGEVAKPGKMQIEDVLKGIDLEERIYRLRCVEAWSMVVPWVGFPVKKVLDKFEPLGSAKYVKFTTLYRPKEMPGIRSIFSSVEFPYVEGLRLDEANHPLAIFAVGMYGKILPNQNGAPFRLVVPWKYGFKSIKSIVKIELTKREPRTTWNRSAPHEYGFYANVNPEVDHPRWSQARERRLPTTIFGGTIATRMFNGYDEVASLYEGMDLKRNY